MKISPRILYKTFSSLVTWMETSCTYKYKCMHAKWTQSIFIKQMQAPECLVKIPRYMYGIHASLICLFKPNQTNHVENRGLDAAYQLRCVIMWQETEYNAPAREAKEKNRTKKGKHTRGDLEEEANQMLWTHWCKSHSRLVRFSRCTEASTDNTTKTKQKIERWYKILK